MSNNPSDLQETLAQRLALSLQENDYLKTLIKNMTEQLEAMEEILMRLQTKNPNWELSNDGMAHHLNHQ